jgi:hypothetical protein
LCSDLSCEGADGRVEPEVQASRLVGERLDQPFRPCLFEFGGGGEACAGAGRVQDLVGAWPVIVEAGEAGEGGGLAAVELDDLPGGEDAPVVGLRVVTELVEESPRGGVPGG